MWGLKLFFAVMIVVTVIATWALMQTIFSVIERYSKDD